MCVIRRLNSLGLWLCFWLVLPGAAGGAGEVVQVTGRVVDPQGQGIEGAKLQIERWRSHEPVEVATTQADGRFIISRLPIGCRMCLLIDAEGCGREYRDDIDVFPQRATDLGPIRVFPGCVCEGRVIAIDGQPAAGIEIVVHAYRHELGHTINAFGPNWKLKSDALGRFVTPPLPSCYATFEVKPPSGSVPARVAREYIGPDTSQLQVPGIQLVSEVPLEGVVTDKLGKPILGAEVWCSPSDGDPVKTDASGRFTLHGTSAKTVHEARVGVDAAGFASYFEQEKPKDELPRKIVLTPCGYIAGRAVDAETGEPVEIKRVVVCEVRRDADGTPHSHGCGEARFEQPRTGEFRISVSTGGEKHLTVMADRYHYAERYVFGFALLKGVQDVTIKMRRDGSPATAARQRIRGIVRSGSQPAAEVWVSLWQKKKEWDPVNATVLRGRTIDGTYRPSAVDVLTAGDGSYLLDVADPGDYYVVARPLHGAPTSSQPVLMRADEEQTCDLNLQPGGTIRGRVIGVAPEIAERLSVVAFGHTPFRRAAPVDRNGEFVLDDVPPGEIGLKVGHEGYLDADVPRYPWPNNDVWKASAEPWKRAVSVTVIANQDAGRIELEYPKPGPPDGQVE